MVPKKTLKTVCLYLEVSEERRPAVLSRAMTFFHEHGIEVLAGDACGIPFITFDKPDWEEDRILELRQEFQDFMAAMNIQESTGEIS